jgi:Undecaprenyl-phosphate glucose phosphotransferase
MSVTSMGSLESVGLGLGERSAPMKRVSRRVAMDVVGLIDVMAVVLGAILPAWIYAQAGGLQIHEVTIVKSALMTSMLFFVCMQAWNMYDVSRVNDLPIKPGRLLAALFLATFAALGLGVPFSVAEIHLWVWYAAWISASFVAILGMRLVCRFVLQKMTAAGAFDTRVAVFGAGEIARRVRDNLRNEATGIRFVGVYDDRPRDRLDADTLDIKGRLEDLMAQGRNGTIDQIIIALPQSADRRMAMIANQLQQLPVSIHMVTHLSSDLVEGGPAHKVSAIGGVGLLDVKDRPLTDWAPAVKRAEDIVLGGLLFLVTLPVMLIIAIAIKLESKGPVLFRQRRRGLNFAIFDVLKFRTMTCMEDGQTIAQAQAFDPRVTRVGRVLRRMSLDELPQLINVLKGEMSLVGPRPHALAHDAQWGEQVKTYGIRHQMKPGITGLAQVEGWRGEVTSQNDIASRVKEDLAYIRNWSLELDLAILARTFRAVLFAKNAY